MMSDLKQYQWLTRCMGMEILVRADGSYVCRICTVSINKGALNIENKEEAICDKASLFKRISGTMPLALTISGKGVLARQVARTEEGEEAVLPGLKTEEFYFQRFESGSSAFIALARKDLIDGILDLAEKAGVKVLHVSLGVFVVSQILQQLNSYGELCFEGHSIHHSKELEWLDYTYSEGLKARFPIKIGLEPLQEEFLIAYATAFQLVLFPQLNVIGIPLPSVEQRFKSYESQTTFKFRVAVLLVVTFVLLVANFLVFSFYNGQNERLSSKADMDNASSDSINRLSGRIMKHEVRLKELGWHNGVSYAWIADQLGQSLRKGLRLSELELNPLNAEESNRLRKEVFATGKLRIRGEAADLTALNDWIFFLKDSPWVKGLELQRFGPSQAGVSQDFEIYVAF